MVCRDKILKVWTLKCAPSYLSMAMMTGGFVFNDTNSMTLFGHGLRCRFKVSVGRDPRLSGPDIVAAVSTPDTFY